MKILESYKKMAKSMLTEHAWDRKFGEPLPTLDDVMREAEVDDKKMIKYKDKDGEAKEMPASSAKTMEKEHPAKIAYDKMADTGGEEEPKSKGLGKGDFERDFDDEEPEDSDEPFEKDGGFSTDDDEDDRGDEEPEGDEEPSGEPEGGGELGQDEYGNITGTAEQWKSGEHDEAAAKHYEDYEIGIDYDMAQAQRDDKQNERWFEDGQISQEKYEEKHDEAAADMEMALAAKRHTKNQGGKEESITINGKQYRPIKDSVEPKKHLLREMYERIGGK